MALSSIFAVQIESILQASASFRYVDELGALKAADVGLRGDFTQGPAFDHHRNPAHFHRLD